MNRIQKMIDFRLNELALLEMEQNPNENLEPEMVTYSVRLPVEVNKDLEIIAEELKLKKSDLTRELLYQSTREALIRLKIDPADWAESKLVEKGDKDE